MLDFSEMNLDEENLPKNEKNQETMSHIENIVFPEECKKNRTCATCEIIEKVKVHISKIDDKDIESWLLDAYFNEISWAIHVKDNYSDSLSENKKAELSMIINSYSARVNFLLNQKPEDLKLYFKDTDFFWRKWTKNFTSNYEEVEKVLRQKIYEELKL